MPSLVTSASGRSGLSRIASISRDWEEEPDVPSSSQSRLEWSPSPERVRRKTPASAPAPFTTPSNTAPDAEGLTPQERRRRAILQGMSMNTPSSSDGITFTGSKPAPSTAASSTARSSTASSSTARSSTSTLLTSSRLASFSSPKPPLSAPAPEQQALPELPTLDVKKRSRPWEDDFTSAKKVMDAGRMMSRTNSSSSTGAKKSKPAFPTVNIRNKLVLSSEQQAVLRIVVDEGKNVFFTGSAGTGKSVLLREIIKSLSRKYHKANDAVAVTASTGIAACNIGGTTLHSFGGVGLALEDAAELVKKVKRNKKAASRWTRTKVLIIDEISMVDAELFDKYNKIAQLMRKRPGIPFGGMQLICTGDFFQLPPVTKNGEPRFCFEAATWREAIHTQINLTKVFRQRDQRFVEMLNEMRFGKLRPESLATFRGLDRPVITADGIEPTELFPRREDVDRANDMRLRNINDEGWTYGAEDGGAITDPVQKEKMLANFMAPKSLQLKVGAQVMLIKNIDETLVNGSLGKVIGFCHKVEYITDAHGRWRQHGVEEDIEHLDGHDEEQKDKMLSKLRSAISSSARPFPVVRFTVPGGGSRDMFVEYDQFKTELPNGEVQVSRSQLPLILAWAMSIHKAQGQTLAHVKVDLSKVFEKGQAYVALSRATSLEGLQVKGFTANKVMAHPKVTVWSQQLRDLNV